MSVRKEAHGKSALTMRMRFSYLGYHQTRCACPELGPLKVTYNFQLTMCGLRAIYPWIDHPDVFGISGSHSSLQEQQTPAMEPCLCP